MPAVLKKTSSKPTCSPVVLRKWVLDIASDLNMFNVSDIKLEAIVKSITVNTTAQGIERMLIGFRSVR